MITDSISLNPQRIQTLFSAQQTWFLTNTRFWNILNCLLLTGVFAGVLLGTLPPPVNEANGVTQDVYRNTIKVRCHQNVALSSPSV